jgi:hypothetical protein
MKRFIEGADREQSTLLPESLDDWIDDSNPVRAVDVFVDGSIWSSSASTAFFRRQRAGRPTPIKKVCAQFVMLCRKMGWVCSTARALPSTVVTSRRSTRRASSR